MSFIFFYSWNIFKCVEWGSCGIGFRWDNYGDGWWIGECFFIRIIIYKRRGERFCRVCVFKLFGEIFGGY